MNPLDVACTRCGAAPGHECILTFVGQGPALYVKIGGRWRSPFVTPPHPARRAAAAEEDAA